MGAQVPGLSLGFSKSVAPVLSAFSKGSNWAEEDFIMAHELVRASGKFNFEYCKIPIPTAIRYDRIRAALGDSATSKDERVLCLLEFGMPLNCKVRLC